jgi:siroheme decarboxylase
MVNQAAQQEVSEYELRQVLQEGLPLVARPYQNIAQKLATTEQAIIEKIAELKQRGLIKRFGLVLQHHELGYTANCMVVWDIPDKNIEQVAQQLSAEPPVTLCYKRPRRANWPFNLFCMIHGKKRGQVQQQIESIIRKHQLTYPHELLFSTRQFKQRGARYV